MEFLLLWALLLALVVVVAGPLALAVLPIGRYRFELAGRRIEVRNYLVGERIFVDDEPVYGTRIAGDLVSHAVHAIPLPDGRSLDVVLRARGLWVRCVAKIDGEVVFDSAGRGGHRDPAAEVPTDARWVAAKVLIDELVSEPGLTDAVRSLEVELRGAMVRLQQARRAAEAHTALGGTGDDADRVVAHREDVVRDLLALLRELHLAAGGPPVEASAVERVEDVLHRLEAEREVDAVRLRQVAAARSRAARAARG